MTELFFSSQSFPKGIIEIFLTKPNYLTTLAQKRTFDTGQPWVNS